MPSIISIADGNFTSASTWAVVDATSFVAVDSNGNFTPTQTTVITSATFTITGPSTIQGVCLTPVTVSAGSVGTVTVGLYAFTGSVLLSQVTVSYSALAKTWAGNSSARGWIYFKFPTTVDIASNTTCYLAAQRSADCPSLTISCQAAGAVWWAKMLVTTTTRAPIADDQIHVLGATTASGVTACTVTMDNTATTSFGTIAQPQGVTISNGGTLTFGTAAATNYKFKWKGVFGVYDGGTLNVGTSSTPIPIGSTVELITDCVTNVDTGMYIGVGGNCNMYGSKGFNTTTPNHFTYLSQDIGGHCDVAGTAVTSLEGRSFVGLTGTISINGVNYTIASVTNATQLTLTATAGTQTFVTWVHAGTSNVLKVDDTTGWAIGDALIVTPTGKNGTDTEKVIVQTIDSSTQATLTTSLTKPHLGTEPFRAEVGNLTRNVVMRGTSGTLQGYFTATDFSYVYFNKNWIYWFGSAITNKRGVEFNLTNTGQVTITDSVVSDGIAASSHGYTIGNACLNNVNFVRCIGYNTASIMLTNISTSKGVVVTDCLFVLGGSVQLYGISGTFTNNTIVGMTSVGLAITIFVETFTIVNNVVHNVSGQAGVSLSGCNYTIDGLKIVKVSNVGILCTAAANILITNSKLIGGVNQLHIYNSTADDIVFSNCQFWGTNLYKPNYQFNLAGCSSNFTFKNCDFGANVVAPYVNLASSQLASIPSSRTAKILFENCQLPNTTINNGQAIGDKSSVCFRSQNTNGVAGDHWTVTREGKLQPDTTIYRTSTPSLRMIPYLTTAKLRSSPFIYNFGFKRVVDSGATITASVWVRKSVVGDGAVYNGAQPRLILRQNTLGISTDTVLATATQANGIWEQLTATTPAATDNGIFEFVVDCDGTTGFVNVDDFS